jgi:prolipoprotein diacylglyceryltransferase
MPDLTTTIGFWTLPTYTWSVGLALLISGGIALYRLRHTAIRLSHAVDVYLGGLIVGVVLARLLHILLNWNYFTYNLNEAFQLSAGGLNWHGAVIGGLIGIGIMARWRHIPARDLIDGLTPSLALVTLAVWYGCWAAACAYGKEVATLADYPAFIVWEGPDIFGLYAPRFNTHPLGMGFALFLLVVALVSLRIRRLMYWRFWLLLALASLGMFGLGFLRGDYAITIAVGDGHLRLDQGLDILMLILALAVMLWQIRANRQPNNTPKRASTEETISDGNL